MKTFAFILVLAFASQSFAAESQCANGRCSVAKAVAKPVVAASSVTKHVAVAGVKRVRSFGIVRRMRCR